MGIADTSWEICMQVKKQQLEPDMEQQTVSKLGKEYIKAVYSPCLFNIYAEYIMWNARLDEHKLESRLQGDISITSELNWKSTGLKIPRGEGNGTPFQYSENPMDGGAW